jgi:hypothetical protein
MKQAPNKFETRGEQMRELGKLIQGIVWGCVFIAVLVFIGYQVTFG